MRRRARLGVWLAALLSGCSYAAAIEAGPVAVGNDLGWNGGGELEATLAAGWTGNRVVLEPDETLWVSGRVRGAFLDARGLLSAGALLGMSFRTGFGGFFLHLGADFVDVHVDPTAVWAGALGPVGRVGLAFALDRHDETRTFEARALDLTVARSARIESTLLTITIGAEYDVLFDVEGRWSLMAHVGIAWWSEHVDLALFP